MTFISRNRRVAPYCDPSESGFVEELTREGFRVIHFKGRPDQYMQYQQLQKYGLANLKLTKSDNDLDWEEFSVEIPKGSVLIGQQLYAISKSENIAMYVDLFEALGEYVAKIIHDGEILPEPTNIRTFLNTFIIYPSDNEKYGVNIALAPPYYLEAIEDEVKAVARTRDLLLEELTANGMFTLDDIDLFLIAFNTGIYFNGRQ